jgi:hypothetical protein
MIYLRDASGHQIPIPPNPPPPPPPAPQPPPRFFEMTLPFRSTNSRVVHVTELRRRLNQARAQHPTQVNVTGSASYAIAVLDPPWRQRFEGTVDDAGTQMTSGGFVATLQIAQRVALATTFDAVSTLVINHGG